jgi:hypothetical protein
VRVGDLDIIRMTFGPAKTDPPLLVHADAVLALTVSAEFLQTISWSGTQIVQRLRRVQHQQLAEGGARFSSPVAAERVVTVSLSRKLRIIPWMLTPGASTGKQLPSALEVR